MEPERAQRRAIARALANGGATTVTRLRYGLYAVASASRPGTAHRVSVDVQGRYACSCPAGLSGRPCWHAGAVFIARLEHDSGVRVVAGTSGPAPPPPRAPGVATRGARRVDADLRGAA
jgi:hypothetical protein